MRKLIAHIIDVPLLVLFNLLVCPLCLLRDYIYVEGTVRPMNFWLDEKKEKVRFSLGGRSYHKFGKHSVGIKLPQWHYMVDEINKSLGEEK